MSSAEDPAPQTWRRDAPQWHNVSDLDWVPVPGFPGAEGLQGKLISRATDASGSQTWLLRLPPGWSQTIDAIGTLEYCVVNGELSAGESLLGVGGFIGVAEGASVVLSYAAGGLIVAF